MGDAEQIEYCADLCRLAEACPFSDLTVQRVPRKKNPKKIPKSFVSSDPFFTLLLQQCCSFTSYK
jgi:hypothetical protein